MTEHKWRRSDFISIATLLTVATWIWFASAKVSLVDQDIQRGNDSHKGFDALDNRVTTLEVRGADWHEQEVALLVGLRPSWTFGL